MLVTILPSEVGSVAAPSLSAPAAPVRRSINAKHIVFILFGLTILVSIITRDLALLDSSSPLRQRYTSIPGLMLAHGVPGALALILGIFQFSNRLRARYLNIHRILGRVYVGSTFIAAPVSVAVAAVLGPPTLLMASVAQAGGWLFCTAVALYCVRQGNITQHRHWMMRGYPFAMIFAINRTVIAIPAVARLGELGIVSTVWFNIVLAAFVPSVVIAWQQTFARKPVPAPRAVAKAAD